MKIVLHFYSQKIHVCSLFFINILQAAITLVNVTRTFLGKASFLSIGNFYVILVLQSAGQHATVSWVIQLQTDGGNILLFNMPFHYSHAHEAKQSVSILLQSAAVRQFKNKVLCMFTWQIQY